MERLYKSQETKQLETLTKHVRQEQIVGIQSIPVIDLVKPDYYCRQTIPGREKLIPASIGTLGYVSPIIVNVNPDRKFIVIDGNSRVEYFRTQHIPEILAVKINVSLSDEKKLHYLLNERASMNDPDQIMEFLGDMTPEFFGLSLPDMQDTEMTNEEINDSKQHKITRMMFAFSKAEYDKIIVKMDNLKKNFKVNNRSKVLIQLIEHYYENTND